MTDEEEIVDIRKYVFQSPSGDRCRHCDRHIIGVKPSMKLRIEVCSGCLKDARYCRCSDLKELW